MAKPFVKWAGGKTQILDQLKSKYPQELSDGTLTKYVEPFVGGGAVLFDILSSYPTITEVYICDIIPGLVNTYLAVRDSIDVIIGELNILESVYKGLSQVDRSKMYYVIRDEYNKESSKPLISHYNIENAARFIFLNRTCFNGLFRVNSSGGFNVPCGSYSNPTICNEKELREVSLALKKVTIVCGDYKQLMQYIDDKTFVYIDPPYRPISKTSNFTTYNKDGFTDKDQKELADKIIEMDSKYAHIMLSNSDPKNINPNDTFFDKLYTGFTMHSILAKRSIGSGKDSRIEVKEILVTNY